MYNSDGHYLIIFLRSRQKLYHTKSSMRENTQSINIRISEIGLSPLSSWSEIGTPPPFKNHTVLQSKGSIIGIDGCVVQLLNFGIALFKKIVLPCNFLYLGCWVKLPPCTRWIETIIDLVSSSLQWIKIHMLEESLKFEIICARVKYKKVGTTFNHKVSIFWQFCMFIKI